MNEILLKEDERLDDLLIGNYSIIQRDDQFRFSLDSVLLAHFASLKKKARVVDLGTGTGVLLLLLAARGAGQMLGIELNHVMADMAKRSVEWNGLSERIRIEEADYRQVQQALPAGEWDLVIANPPYRVPGEGKISQNSGVASARHEISAALPDVIAAGRYLTKWRGRFAMVHLPERMAEILRLMSEADLEPKRLRLVHSRLDRKPNMLLVEGIRGGQPGLEVLPPLVVYDHNGEYSEEIQQYYHDPR